MARSGRRAAGNSHERPRRLRPLPEAARLPGAANSPADLVFILREAAPEDPDAIDPGGDAVPPADRAVIGDLLATWQLCLASGDVPGVLGLFTEDGFVAFLGSDRPSLAVRQG